MIFIVTLFIDNRHVIHHKQHKKNCLWRHCFPKYWYRY